MTFVCQCVVQSYLSNSLQWCHFDPNLASPSPSKLSSFPFLFLPIQAVLLPVLSSHIILLGSSLFLLHPLVLVFWFIPRILSPLTCFARPPALSRPVLCLFFGLLVPLSCTQLFFLLWFLSTRLFSLSAFFSAPSALLALSFSFLPCAFPFPSRCCHSFPRLVPFLLRFPTWVFVRSDVLLSLSP